MKKVFLIIALFAFIILPMRVLAEDAPHTETADEIGKRVWESCEARGGGNCGGEAAAAYSKREREIKSEGNAQEREQLKNDDKKREEETKRKEAAKATTTQGTTIPGSAPTTNGLSSGVDGYSLAGTGSGCTLGEYETSCVGINEESVSQCNKDGVMELKSYRQNNPDCKGDTGKNDGKNKCLTGEANAKDCTSGTGGKPTTNSNAISSVIMNKKGCENGAWETACTGEGKTEDVAKCVNGQWERQPRQTNEDCVKAKRGDRIENKAAQEGTRLEMKKTIDLKGCKDVGGDLACSIANDGADWKCVGAGNSCVNTAGKLKVGETCVVENGADTRGCDCDNGTHVGGGQICKAINQGNGTSCSDNSQCSSNRCDVMPGARGSKVCLPKIIKGNEVCGADVSIDNTCPCESGGKVAKGSKCPVPAGKVCSSEAKTEDAGTIVGTCDCQIGGKVNNGQKCPELGSRDNDQPCKVGDECKSGSCNKYVGTEIDGLFCGPAPVSVKGVIDSPCQVDSECGNKLTCGPSGKCENK